MGRYTIAESLSKVLNCAGDIGHLRKSHVQVTLYIQWHLSSIPASPTMRALLGQPQAQQDRNCLCINARALYHVQALLHTFAISGSPVSCSTPARLSLFSWKCSRHHKISTNFSFCLLPLIIKGRESLFRDFRLPTTIL
jgi:hypothetical protein